MRSYHQLWADLYKQGYPSCEKIPLTMDWLYDQGNGWLLGKLWLMCEIHWNMDRNKETRIISQQQLLMHSYLASWSNSYHVNARNTKKNVYLSFKWEKLHQHVRVLSNTDPLLPGTLFETLTYSGKYVLKMFTDLKMSKYWRLPAKESITSKPFGIANQRM